MEPAPIFSAPIVYRERGAFLRRIEKFNKAKASYDIAYNYKQDDIRILSGRSQVCIDAMQPVQAYTDAELALQLEPNNMTACNMQARALYTMLEFERSLVVNYRGARRRRLPRYFVDGIGECLETIQDSIGKNVGKIMTNFLDIIKQNESSGVDENEPENVLHISRIPHVKTKTKLTQMEARRQGILSRVLAMKYLGPMAWDKFFLHELSGTSSKSKSLKSANVKVSQDLNELVNTALHTISERQEMLRVQRPYYAVVQAEKSVSHYQTLFREKILNNERKAGARTANLYLKQILMCYTQNKMMDLDVKVDSMQVFLDSKTPHTLPKKEYYTNKLYTLVGKALLAQYRLSYDLPDSGNRRRVAFLLGLPVNRPTSYDSVIHNYPNKRLDIQAALETMMNTFEICENICRRCWLTYNIGRLLLARKNYPLSKYYGNLCQGEAVKIESEVWWLNGCFVILSTDMQQGNVNEIRSQVEEAYHWAKRLKKSEVMLAFLAKCAEMAGEPIVTDKRKAILRREAAILKVIDKSLRSEAQVLFKRISMVPSGRRFSVLPIKTKYGDGTAERQKRRQRGLSVIPGPEQVLPRALVSNVMGLQIFDI